VNHFDIPGAGELWRVVRQGNLHYLQVKNMIGRWQNISQHDDTEHALDAAHNLFAPEIQVWPPLNG
jgi:hypothetical protein